jgi:hypothetical protein
MTDRVGLRAVHFVRVDVQRRRGPGVPEKGSDRTHVDA